MLGAPKNMSCEDKLKRCGLIILAGADKIMSQALKNIVGNEAVGHIKWERFFKLAPDKTNRDKCKINIVRDPEEGFAEILWCKSCKLIKWSG